MASWQPALYSPRPAWSHTPLFGSPVNCVHASKTTSERIVFCAAGELTFPRHMSIGRHRLTTVPWPDTQGRLASWAVLALQSVPSGVVHVEHNAFTSSTLLLDRFTADSSGFSAVERVDYTYIKSRLYIYISRPLRNLLVSSTSFKPTNRYHQTPNMSSAHDTSDSEWSFIMTPEPSREPTPPLERLPDKTLSDNDQINAKMERNCLLVSAWKIAQEHSLGADGLELLGKEIMGGSAWCSMARAIEMSPDARSRYADRDGGMRDPATMPRRYGGRDLPQSCGRPQGDVINFLCRARCRLEKLGLLDKARLVDAWGEGQFGIDDYGAERLRLMEGRIDPHSERYRKHFVDDEPAAAGASKSDKGAV